MDGDKEEVSVKVSDAGHEREITDADEASGDDHGQKHRNPGRSPPVDPAEACEKRPGIGHSVLQPRQSGPASRVVLVAVIIATTATTTALRDPIAAPITSANGCSELAKAADPRTLMPAIATPT